MPRSSPTLSTAPWCAHRNNSETRAVRHRFPINDSARRLRHFNCLADRVRKRYGTSRENGAGYECVCHLGTQCFITACKKRGAESSRPISSLHYHPVYRRGPALANVLKNELACGNACFGCLLGRSSCLERFIISGFVPKWRRGWDSNPRYAFDVYSLSRGAPSTTRPPLRCGLIIALKK